MTRVALMKFQACLFRCLFAVLVCLLGNISAAIAANADKTCATPGRGIVLTNSAANMQYQLSGEYFLDPSGTVTPDAIIHKNFNANANACDGVFPGPLPGQVLWLRFDLTNDWSVRQHLIVTFAEPVFDEISLFTRQADGLALLARNGRIVPTAQKATQTLKPALPVVVDAEATSTYYIRISGAIAPTVTALLMTDALFDEWSTLSTVISGIFLSYVATILFLSLVIFRQINARFYKYYALYMGSLFAFTFVYDDWLNSFTNLSLTSATASSVTYFLGGLGSFTVIQYCRVLLEVDDQQPRLRLLLKLLTYTTVLATGLAVIEPWQLSLPLQLMYFLNPLTLLIVALGKIRSGLPQAVPISIALFIFTGGLVVAVYSFIFPISIDDAHSAFELFWQHPLSWGYFLAVLGEATFMIIAISVMAKSAKNVAQSAVLEVSALRDNLAKIETENAKIQQAAVVRIETLEDLVAFDPDKKLLPPVDQRFVDRATQCVQEQIGNESFSVRDLAQALAVSPKTLGRRLQKTQNMTTNAFIRSVRLNYARNLIVMRQHETVAEVSHACGFASVSHFTKQYREEFDETPGETLKAANSSN